MLNASSLSFDSHEIERQLRAEFESALVAWAKAATGRKEQARQQVDRAEKRLTDLIVDNKLPEK